MVSIKKSLPLNFRHLSLEGTWSLIEYIDANSDFSPLIELTKTTTGGGGGGCQEETEKGRDQVSAAIM